MQKFITWKLLLAFVATILLQDVAAVQDRAKYSLAVLELEGSGRVSSSDASDLTERFREELRRAGIFQVVDKTVLKSALTGRGLSLAGCNTKECAVQVGRAAGTKLVVTGSVSKVGPLYFIQVQLIHVKSGEVVESVSEDFDGEFEALKAHMAVVARKLSGQSQTATSRATAPEFGTSDNTETNQSPAVENAASESTGADAFDYKEPAAASSSSKGGGSKALVIGLIVVGAVGGGFLISQALKKDEGDGVKPPPTGGNLPNPPTFP